MAGEDQSLVFTLVFNKDTGQLTAAQQDLDKTAKAAQGVGTAGAQAGKQAADGFKGAGEAAKKGGKEAEDATQKVGKEVTNMAKSFLIAQLAMQGFQAVAKESEAFQELQATLTDTAATILNDLKPSLDLASKGLQGLALAVGGVAAFVAPIISSLVATLKGALDLIMAEVGAALNLMQGNFRGAWESIKQGGRDAVAEYKGLGQQFQDGWAKMVKGFEDAAGRIEGRSHAHTQAMTASMNTLLQAQQAHNEASLKSALDTFDQAAQELGVNEETKLALIDASEQAQLATQQQNEALKLESLKNSLDAHMVTLRDYEAQVKAATLQGEDARNAISQAASDRRKAMARQESEQLKQAFYSTESAFVSSLAKQIASGKSFSEAMKEASAEVIRTLADEASRYIMIKGAEAAAKAFESAPNVYVGAAQAAGVLAWYGGLAAAVGVAGNIAANSISGSGGGGSDQGGGSSSGGAVSSASSEGSQAMTASGEATTGSASGVPVARGAAGLQQINVVVMLDSQPILKAVSKASYSGDIAISLRAIDQS